MTSIKLNYENIFYSIVCKKYIRNGTTGDSSCLAFITCFMSYVL